MYCLYVQYSVRVCAQECSILSSADGQIEEREADVGEQDERAEEQNAEVEQAAQRRRAQRAQRRVSQRRPEETHRHALHLTCTRAQRHRLMKLLQCSMYL